MLLDALPQRQTGGIFFERGHVRRRIVRRLGDDLSRQPRAALHRIRFAAVRKTRHDRRLGEQAAQFRPCVRNRHEFEAALRLVGEIVIAGDGFVRDDEIRLDQIPHRQVIADQVLHKLDGLLPAVAHAYRGSVWDTVCDPVRAPGTCRDSATGGEFAARTARSADRRSSASTSASRCCAQRARRGQLQRLAIGRPVPQEVRELRSQLVSDRAAPARASCCFRSSNRNCGEVSTTMQRVLHAVLKAASRGAKDFAKHGHQRSFFAGGDRPAVGARRELANDFARVRRRIVLAVGIDEDVPDATRGGQDS